MPMISESKHRLFYSYTLKKVEMTQLWKDRLEHNYSGPDFKVHNHNGNKIPEFRLQTTPAPSVG